MQLVPWPIPRPADWLANANRRIAEAELNTIRLHIQRGRRFGTDAWMRQAVRQIGLLSTFRDYGRPPKKTKQTARIADRCRISPYLGRSGQPHHPTLVIAAQPPPHH